MAVGYIFRGLMYLGGLYGAKEVADFGSETVTGKSVFENVADSEFGQTVAQSEELAQLNNVIDQGIAATGLSPEETRARISSAVEGVDQTAEGAVSAVAGAVGATAEQGWDWLNNIKGWGNEATKDYVYKTFFEGMGLDRDTYDGWYDTIDAFSILQTFGVIMGANFAGSKLGLGLDTQTALGIAIAYTVLDRVGAKDWAMDKFKEMMPNDVAQQVEAEVQAEETRPQAEPEVKQEPSATMVPATVKPMS